MTDHTERGDRFESGDRCLRLFRMVDVPSTSGTHRLQIIVVCEGRSSYAEVSRWDGTQWHKVVRLGAESLDNNPPTYTASVSGPAKNIVAVKDWLRDTADISLLYAKDVIL